MQRLRKVWRVLIPLLAAQIAAMTLMIGAAALVVEPRDADAEAPAVQAPKASSQSPHEACDRSNALDLILL